MVKFYSCLVNGAENSKYLVVKREWIFNLGKGKALKESDSLMVYHNDNVAKKRPRQMSTPIIITQHDDSKQEFIMKATSFKPHGK